MEKEADPSEGESLVDVFLNLSSSFQTPTKYEICLS